MPFWAPCSVSFLALPISEPSLRLVPYYDSPVLRLSSSPSRRLRRPTPGCHDAETTAALGARQVRTGVDPFSWTPRHCSEEVFAMAKTHAPYAPEYRQQMIELVRDAAARGKYAPLYRHLLSACPGAEWHTTFGEARDREGVGCASCPARFLCREAHAGPLWVALAFPCEPCPWRRCRSLRGESIAPNTGYALGGSLQTGPQCAEVDAPVRGPGGESEASGQRGFTVKSRPCASPASSRRPPA